MGADMGWVDGSARHRGLAVFLPGRALSCWFALLAMPAGGPGDITATAWKRCRRSHNTLQ
ncbi:hypothetical protein RAA17_06410 [Komagataeibacter rhaeticus]|nr:hypothetical protein [Komagataeibacter rhaeticus]